MEDHTPQTLHTQPLPTSHSLHWVLWFSQAGEERRGRLVGVQRFEFQEWLELKPVLCFLSSSFAWGLQGALFTRADTPGVAESPNCFTASLSCVRHSLWTWISHREKLRGHGGEHCPCPVLKDKPNAQMHRAMRWRTNKVFALWGVSREVSNSLSEHRREL